MVVVVGVVGVGGGGGGGASSCRCCRLVLTLGDRTHNHEIDDPRRFGAKRQRPEVTEVGGARHLDRATNHAEGVGRKSC